MKLQMLLLFLFSVLVLVSCKKDGETKKFVVKEVQKPVLGRPEWKPGAQPAKDPLEGLVGADRGKHIFLNTCTQCHNKDPNLNGPIGPIVVDAPLEVMVSKVMTGKYPEKLPAGFVPKRDTRAMRPLPHLEAEIPNIYEYVQSVKK